LGVAFAAGGDALGAVLGAGPMPPVEPSMVAASSAQPAEGLGRVVDGVTTNGRFHSAKPLMNLCAQRVGAGALGMQQAAAGGACRRQRGTHGQMRVPRDVATCQTVSADHDRRCAGCESSNMCSCCCCMSLLVCRVCLCLCMRSLLGPALLSPARPDFSRDYIHYVIRLLMCGARDMAYGKGPCE